MNNWSNIDFLFFLVFFLNTIIGMSRGAAKEIIAMMCLSVALIFTIKFTIPLSQFLQASPIAMNVLDSAPIQNFLNAIHAGPLTAQVLNQLILCLSLLICFIGIYSIGAAVLQMSGFLEVFTFRYAALNRKIGGALGCTRGYIYTLILIILINHIFINYPVNNSYFINLFQNAATRLDGFIVSQKPENYKDVYKDKDLFHPQKIVNEGINSSFTKGF